MPHDSEGTSPQRGSRGALLQALPSGDEVRAPGAHVPGAAAPSLGDVLRDQRHAVQPPQRRGGRPEPGAVARAAPLAHGAGAQAGADPRPGGHLAAERPGGGLGRDAISSIPGFESQLLRLHGPDRPGRGRQPHPDRGPGGWDRRSWRLAARGLAGPRETAPFAGASVPLPEHSLAAVETQVAQLLPKLDVTARTPLRANPRARPRSGSG